MSESSSTTTSGVCLKTKVQKMKNAKLKSMGSFLSMTTACLSFAATTCATAQSTDQRAPEVPTAIQAPEGNKVHFQAYADGVQIYSWNGSSWVFQAPEAILYDADGNVVGTHYVGPTWESNSGSKVVGARVSAAASPNANSIPLLLLRATATEGPGVLARTTYIQRVNTVGGTAPATQGASVGEVARIPYTAEYFFYRAE
jgi:hypothetical protein